jgi:dynein heavy chain, axonemal
VIALQVGIEKEKVNAENDAAQVEAQKCAVIAQEVSEKQTSCERDLAAAEPLVAQAEAALDTLNKKDLGEAKSLKKPPAGALLHPAARTLLCPVLSAVRLGVPAS